MEFEESVFFDMLLSFLFAFGHRYFWMSTFSFTGPVAIACIYRGIRSRLPLLCIVGAVCLLAIGWLGRALWMRRKAAKIRRDELFENTLIAGYVLDWVLVTGAAVALLLGAGPMILSELAAMDLGGFSSLGPHTVLFAFHLAVSLLCLLAWDMWGAEAKR